MELHAWIAAANGQSHQLWILPDDDGRFMREFAGEITRLVVFSGVKVHSIDPAKLPPADDQGVLDLGAIDLRKSLVAYRVRVRAAEGAPGGVVRAGLSIGPSHTGPNGELPSLGSKQFPPVELGSVVEWLLPPDMNDVHFLVERPSGPGRGINWRSGKQQVFGPFETLEFPLELIMN